MTPEQEKEFGKRAEGFMNDLRELTGYNILLGHLESMLVKRGLMQPIPRDLIKTRKPCPVCGDGGGCGH